MFNLDLPFSSEAFNSTLLTLDLGIASFSHEFGLTTLWLIRILFLSKEPDPDQGHICASAYLGICLNSLHPYLRLDKQMRRQL